MRKVKSLQQLSKKFLRKIITNNRNSKIRRVKLEKLRNKKENFTII